MRTFGYLCLTLLASLAICNVARADDSSDAARVGRMLLSPNEETRHEAEQLLLERIAKGGDVASYVRAMSTALNDWANREERLVEVWITQAVDGTADERERAVRLITALGERAVNRLVMELRHARHHEGAPAVRAQPQLPSPGAATAEPAGAVEPDPGPPLRPAPYDVTVLLDRGMNRVQILNLLRKEANASEVTRAGRIYVVTATDDGHARLKKHIDDTTTARDQRASDKPQTTAEPQKAAADPKKPKADEPEANDDDVEPEANDDDIEQDGKKDGKSGEKSKEVAQLGPAWLFRTVLVRVPRREGLGIYDMRRVGTDFAKFGPLFETTKNQARGTRVKTGSLNDAEVWERFLRTLPDATSVVAPIARVVENHTGETFLGKKLNYRRDVHPAKGGAWMVEQGELRTGLSLSFYATPVRDALSIELTARKTDVARPIPTTKVRPDEGAEPIVLDQPEWSVATTNATFTLEPQGGGALILLDGLDAAGDQVVLMVLHVTRAPAQAMQNAQRVSPLSDKARDG